ncbi:hypothetical protein SNEBB_001195 [Seison nebaliae]|nr:hypothetical protein SNEBB_001195 [Seison nebaliae]
MAHPQYMVNENWKYEIKLERILGKLDISHLKFFDTCIYNNPLYKINIPYLVNKLTLQSLIVTNNSIYMSSYPIGKLSLITSFENVISIEAQHNLPRFLLNEEKRKAISISIKYQSTDQLKMKRKELEVKQKQMNEMKGNISIDISHFKYDSTIIYEDDLSDNESENNHKTEEENDDEKPEKTEIKLYNIYFISQERNTTALLFIAWNEWKLYNSSHSITLIPSNSNLTVFHKLMKNFSNENYTITDCIKLLEIVSKTGFNKMEFWKFPDYFDGICKNIFLYHNIIKTDNCEGEKCFTDRTAQIDVLILHLKLLVRLFEETAHLKIRHDVLQVNNYENLKSLLEILINSFDDNSLNLPSSYLQRKENDNRVEYEKHRMKLKETSIPFLVQAEDILLENNAKRLFIKDRRSLPRQIFSNSKEHEKLVQMEQSINDLKGTICELFYEIFLTTSQPIFYVKRPTVYFDDVPDKLENFESSRNFLSTHQIIDMMKTHKKEHEIFKDDKLKFIKNERSMKDAFRLSIYDWRRLITIDSMITEMNEYFNKFGIFDQLRKESKIYEIISFISYRIMTICQNGKVTEHVLTHSDVVELYKSLKLLKEIIDKSNAFIWSLHPMNYFMYFCSSHIKFMKREEFQEHITRNSYMKKLIIPLINHLL